MFEQFFKRPYYLKRHVDAPLAEERLKYIQHWIERGSPKNTITSIAQYLLRIVEFLPVESRKIITVKEIERAADAWARYQYNHPQKRIPFSKTGQERFTEHATHWLKSLNLLEPLPEESVPLFNKIFERRHALRRHTSAPLLKERLMYLQYWDDNGSPKGNLKGTAEYLLIVMNYLNFYQLRMVSPNELEKAADLWASNEDIKRRGSNYSEIAKARFARTASGWFDMLSCLEKPIKPTIPFDEYLTQYVAYMREEQGLSKNTIDSKNLLIQDFLIKIHEKKKDFLEITPLLVDEVLMDKHKVDGYSRRTIQTYASIIRVFLRYAETQGWCQKNLADSIKLARTYRHESLPYSPSWDDVKKILADSKTEVPTDIRDHAILMLLSVYGMRCSEVTHLRLEDLDWKNELLHLRRAKGSKPQIFPLSKPVGDAILNYLKKARQNNCSLREVFLCRRAPYRPLTNPAIYRIVSARLKPLSPNIKHHGPHALRHACATHLINEGVSLKEISDHLGHQGLETTRIYSKVDLSNLRKVAEFELGDLL